MFLVFLRAEIELVIPIYCANLRCIKVVYTCFVEAICAPDEIDNDRLPLIAIVEIEDQAIKCLKEIVVLLDEVLHLAEALYLGGPVSCVASQD